MKVGKRWRTPRALSVAESRSLQRIKPGVRVMTYDPVFLLICFRPIAFTRFCVTPDSDIRSIVRSESSQVSNGKEVTIWAVT